MVRTVVTESNGRTRPGQVRRLEELYRAHAPEAMRLAYLLTGDRVLAEDLTQDAFVKVLGHFQDLRNRDAFWWYLRRTVVNLSRSSFRRRQVERAYLGRQRPPEAIAGPDVGERERVRRALLNLRPEQRAAVVLRYYEDMSEADTAEILGRPLGTVKSMVSRGIDRLREELTGDD
ncbi:MAG TPA: SigE family RNA polymerase sigma factor [Actinomycetota bacterium]|jgi:RNA polymerase sigma-70 factor (sigma-E family)|nr:SigE family RNA polymerase sigma factor [Actinomycetota bacterium]